MPKVSEFTSASSVDRNVQIPVLKDGENEVSSVDQILSLAQEIVPLGTPYGTGNTKGFAFSSTGSGAFTAVDWELPEDSAAWVRIVVAGRASGKAYTAVREAHYERTGSGDVTIVEGLNSATGTNGPPCSTSFTTDVTSIQFEIVPGEATAWKWTVIVTVVYAQVTALP